MTKSFDNIIIRPRITEKSAFQSEQGVYSFEILEKATKPEVAQAIRAIYGVTPVKVRIIRRPAKRRLIRGKEGKTARLKKALVYLKKGETITFV